MPADGLAKCDGVRGRKGEERNGEKQRKEATRTYETLCLQVHSSSAKRRGPRMDLSKLTAE